MILLSLDKYKFLKSHSFANYFYTIDLITLFYFIL